MIWCIWMFSFINFDSFKIISSNRRNQINETNQIKQERYENLLHDDWLVVCPHEFNENLNGFGQEKFAVFFTEQFQHSLSIVFFEDPIEVKSFNLKSHRLTIMLVLNLKLLVSKNLFLAVNFFYIL